MFELTVPDMYMKSVSLFRRLYVLWDDKEACRAILLVLFCDWLRLTLVPDMSTICDDCVPLKQTQNAYKSYQK